QSEPVSVSGDWRQRAATLKRHGATPEEIKFLQDERVELNAMTSRELVDFIEVKFAEHSVRKLIPEQAGLAQHARRTLERQLTEKAMAKFRTRIAKEVERMKLPEDLKGQIEEAFVENPAQPWDEALAGIVRGLS